MGAAATFQELTNKYRIGSEYRVSKGSKKLDIIDPATEEVLGQLTENTPQEVDEVIALANKAQKGWSALSGLERAHMLHESARKMLDNQHLLATLMSMEMGKTYKEAIDEVHWSAHAIDYFAEIARHDIGRVMEAATAGQFHYTLKQPRGVAAIILPFNYPLVLLCWEAGAALATGNTVIVKPSDLTTVCTLEFLRCFDNLPDGVVNGVTGVAAVGQQIVSSRDTHAVCFTGSVPVGVSVSEACAKTFKPALIEASGNDPFLVMPSAPMDVAARAASFSAYMNCGQICVSAERFYVHKDIHDEFVDRLVAEAESVRVGNGLDKVDMGPLAAQRERDRFENVIARAREQGAKVATGGTRPSQFNKGWFEAPTVLTDCTPDMDILNNESFGPVAPICKVDSFEQAVELANKSEYGLGANIYTSDLHEGIRATEQLQAGMVWVNAPLLDNDAGPFGGTKMSGIGRQLGNEGLEIFRTTKMIMIDPSCDTQDFWWFPYADNEMYPGD